MIHVEMLSCCMYGSAPLDLFLEHHLSFAAGTATTIQRHFKLLLTGHMICKTFGAPDGFPVEGFHPEGGGLPAGLTKQLKHRSHNKRGNNENMQTVAVVLWQVQVSWTAVLRTLALKAKNTFSHSPRLLRTPTEKGCPLKHSAGRVSNEGAL